MRIYRSLDEAAEAKFRHPVCTLGVFDGVHVGHRFVMRECMSLAAERGGESVVVTFNQHPRGIIADLPPKLITPIEHRLNLFDDLGIDHCLALSFDDDLRQVEAVDFAHQVFEDIIGAEVVVLGHNCRFGKDRVGSAEFLMASSLDYSFATQKAPEIRVGQTILSSTNIRASIEDGDLKLASTMLGRPFSLFGTVVGGDQRGRTIGFPTANLDLHHGLLPPLGVYGCRVVVDGVTHNALTNIGVRPTFEDAESGMPLVEAHLLNFSGDLYGQDLELVFLTWLRAEKKFDGIEALKAQIAQDRTSFLNYLDGGTAG
ncbi:MAG: riboflavin kinase/FMN adenylyltransferase [Planctomycetota bacterium]|jgi:riboflavin kinase/FMN adenylyltransferase